MQKLRRQIHNLPVKVLTFLLLNALSGYMAAQSITFKYRIDNGYANRGTSLIEIDTGYIMIGWGYSAVDPTRYTKLYLTDFEGHITAFREYGESNKFWETGNGSVTVTYDGNFVLGGSRSYQNGCDGLIMKFDKNLDTLWTRAIPSSSYIFFYKAQETIDSGLVFIGSSDETDPDANFILLKTDSAGNEVWRKEYGGPYRDIGWTVELTPDGGFILAGDKYKDSSLDSRIGYLIKTDSSGGVEWDKEIGSGFDDGVFKVSTTSDGGYIVWGALDTVNHSLPAVPYIAKLNQNGSEVWRSVLFKNPRKNSYLFQVKELTSGSFLGVGEIRNDVLPYAIGWMVLESSSGQTLWERYYYWNIDSVMPISFNDFIETSDGGLLVTGYAGFWDENGAGGTQFLLMKLDSNGCLVNDCGLFTGIEEYVPVQDFNLRVYPNPASNYLTISYTTNPTLAIKPEAVIYNLQGQVVQEVFLNGTGYEQISLDGYPSGMYIYQVVSGGQVLGSGKVVVE